MALQMKVAGRRLPRFTASVLSGVLASFATAALQLLTYIKNERFMHQYANYGDADSGWCPVTLCRL